MKGRLRQKTSKKSRRLPGRLPGSRLSWKSSSTLYFRRLTDHVLLGLVQLECSHHISWPTKWQPISKTMKCAIKSDSGSTSTASLSTTLTVEKDESEIMNPKIFCAVRAGDKESLVKRIKDDAKTIQRLVDNHGNSLLHIAAASGHGNIVDYIVSKFPNLVRKGNLMDENALHVAARAGCLTIVEFLVRFVTVFDV
ncbi:hypothetical protein YC2023_015896 [Brassica napus]